MKVKITPELLLNVLIAIFASMILYRIFSGPIVEGNSEDHLPTKPNGNVKNLKHKKGPGERIDHKIKNNRKMAHKNGKMARKNEQRINKIYAKLDMPQAEKVTASATQLDIMPPPQPQASQKQLQNSV